MPPTAHDATHACGEPGVTTGTAAPHTRSERVQPDHLTVHTDLGPREVPQGTTVAALLAQLSAELPRLAEAATAVNGTFVARSAREAHVLQQGDVLTCFSPITGG